MREIQHKFLLGFMLGKKKKPLDSGLFASVLAEEVFSLLLLGNN